MPNPAIVTLTPAILTKVRIHSRNAPIDPHHCGNGP
jgi:hypothetical protein